MKRRHRAAITSVPSLRRLKLGEPPPCKYCSGIIALRLKPVLEAFKHRIWAYRLFEIGDDP